MKIYAFVFLLTCCTFVHARSSSDWKEIIAVTLQIREIKSIIDKVLIPLQIVMYKKGTLEAYSCYNEAKSKLTSTQQIGYGEVIICITNSKKDIAAGIVCAMKSQQTVRKASQTINAEATKCFSDLSIDDQSSISIKNKSSEHVQNLIPIELGIEETI